MNFIFDNKTNRFTVLFSLYITTGGHYDMVKDLRILADHNGVNSQDFKSAHTYLMEEELIVQKEGDHEFFACLSHKGIKAVEEVFLDTDSPTYYFPSYREMQR